MRIAVSGASGLIGSVAARFFAGQGHEVCPLVRRAMRSPAEIPWNPAAGTIDRARLEGLDAIVHLAGENIAGRWSKARKRRLRDSRVLGTQLIAESVAALKRPPAVLVSASATGYYGDRGDGELTEESPPGAGFLASLCVEWEAAAGAARTAGVRVVCARFGVVLSPAGGALGKMLPIFRLGFGGVLGGGRQYLSWIGIDDTVRALDHMLTTASLEGAVNVTAPAPVRAAELARALGRVLRRPAVLPVPAALLRLALGEMAEETVLASQRVLPERLLASGFTFLDRDLDAALARLLAPRRPA